MPIVAMVPIEYLRIPVDGKVVRIEYRRGNFLPAYDERSNDNELNEIWIDHNGHTVVVRQVVITRLKEQRYPTREELDRLVGPLIDRAVEVSRGQPAHPPVQRRD